MGFSHNGVTAPEAEDIAAGLPHLPDRVVLETVRLGQAYREVRTALLALSGVALMHHLAMGDEIALIGVTANAVDCLDRARANLGPSLGSRREAVRSRALSLSQIAGVLQNEATKLQRRTATEPDYRVLRAAARTLSGVAAPKAGLRYLTSSSCTEAVAACRTDHDYHHHEHDHHDS